MWKWIKQKWTNLKKRIHPGVSGSYSTDHAIGDTCTFINALKRRIDHFTYKAQTYQHLIIASCSAGLFVVGLIAVIWYSMVAADWVTWLYFKYVAGIIGTVISGLVFAIGSTIRVQ